MTSTTAPRPRAGVLGALALAADTADEIVLGTVRDVHGAVATRVRTLTGRPAGTGPVTTAVYSGIGCGLRATGHGLRAADRRVGARIEESHAGRVLVSVVNGFIGDRLAEQGSDLAISMAVRVRHRDVAPDRASLAEAFPAATGDVVVFLHGLAEPDTAWLSEAEERGGCYGDRLTEQGWTPVYLRANTGLPIVENGVALASLLDDLVAAWPTTVRRIALVGHSMGGLILRAACAVTTDAPQPWTDLVTNVVTLGTPHLGAPLERGVALGARALGLLPESAPFGRILEYRSVGILDLRGGLASDVQNLPNARYHLVAATLASSRRHPVSETLGDGLVRFPSATGRPRRGPDMFPGADVLHIRGGHFDLLNHPEVDDALRGWLS
jgi:pimeloyl-ACP methyl ester carboxylesterase